MNKPTRDNSLDTVAGIMTIYMIFNHVFVFTSTTESELFLKQLCILGFFMHWFFFKAGMFYKPSADYKVLAVKKYKRLIIPYLVFAIIGQIAHSVLLIVKGDYNITHHTLKPLEYIFTTGAPSGISPLWFLFSLFGATLLFNYIITKKRWLLFAIIVIIPFLLIYTKPYWIANICVGIIFIFLGYKLKELQYNNYIFVVSIILYLLLQTLYPSAVHMRANHAAFGSYILFYPIALFGIISINNIFKRIRYNFPLLSWVGRNSMGFYLIHWVIMTLVETVFVLLSVNNLQLYTISLAVANIVFIPPLIYVIKKSRYSNII